jgi:hypothetical protein
MHIAATESVSLRTRRKSRLVSSNWNRPSVALPPFSGLGTDNFFPVRRQLPISRRMTSTTATCFRFATLLSHRIVGWSRPSKRPAAFKDKACNVASSRFWNGFHVAAFCCFPHASIERTPLVHIPSAVFHVSDLAPPKVECGPSCRSAACAYFFVQVGQQTLTDRLACRARFLRLLNGQVVCHLMLQTDMVNSTDLLFA